MRSLGIRLVSISLVLSTAAWAGDDPGEPSIEQLKTRSVASIEQGLPDIPLERWLYEIAPKGTQIRWFTHDCGEQSGDPAVDAERELPVCTGAAIDVESRDRMIALSFVRDPGSQRFSLHTAALASPSALPPVILRRLADLAGALGTPLTLVSLACPPGTRLREVREAAGLREWYEAADGHPRGPARSWFSEGLYLMEKGEYGATGHKQGPWLECDRFERCRSTQYAPGAP